MNLPELTRPFIEQQNSHNTRDAYAQDLAKWLAFLNSRGIKTPTVEDVMVFKQALESGYAQNTARRIFSTARTFYDWLRKQGLITLNPFELVKGPKTLLDRSPNVPTDIQVERVLRSVQRNAMPGDRDYLILSLLLNGLRAQEVCDLNIDSIFKDDATGHHCVRVIGKGNKERVVPLTDEARDALWEYAASMAVLGGRPAGLLPPHAPLIVDALHDRITRKQVSYVVDKYAKRAGLKGLSPHSFRHHYGTRLYRATRDIVSVGKLLGHTKPETTAIYARMDLSDLVEVARLDPRNPVDEQEYHAKQA